MLSIDDRLDRMLKSFVLTTFLPIFNFGNRTYHWSLGMFDRFSEVFSILFQPSFYVFFEGNITPYPLRKVNTWASGSAAAEFLYCEDTKTFIPWLPGSKSTDETIYKYGGLDEMKLKCLPILSMELVDESGDVVYDVTDFLESVRFCEAPGLPTPNLFHIMAAWSISSHIVPNYDKYILRYINADGDMKTMAPDMSGESEEVSSSGNSEAATTEMPVAEQPQEAVAEQPEEQPQLRPRPKKCATLYE